MLRGRCVLWRAQESAGSLDRLGRGHATYVRRHPEGTVLHELVRQHLETFRAEAGRRSYGQPRGSSPRESQPDLLTGFLFPVSRFLFSIPFFIWSVFSPAPTVEADGAW